MTIPEAVLKFSKMIEALFSGAVCHVNTWEKPFDLVVRPGFYEDHQRYRKGIRHFKKRHPVDQTSGGLVASHIWKLPGFKQPVMEGTKFYR